MTKPKQTTGVFFPPRIVRLNLGIVDHNEVLNDARDRYLLEGIVLLDEDGLREALKIVQYASAFPQVCDPTWEEHECRVQEVIPGPPDPVQNPAHYTEGRQIEPIEVIEDWRLGFHKGNAIKYIARAGRKDNEIQDLEKAVWYLQRYLTLLRNA